ncbi:MAG: endolytic transglycosylase MltG [Solirubrobacteraceae bacterium]
MADRRQRSEAEREAARLERERRRGGSEPQPELEPTPAPTFADPPTDLDPPTQQFDVEFDDGHEHEHELEQASGTRRVSALERRHHRVGRTTASKPPRASGRRRLRRRIGAVIALALAAGLIWFVIQLFQPFIGSPQGPYFEVTIPHGSSSGQVGDLLAKDGVISSSFFFGLRVTLDGDRGSLLAGPHRFKHGMSYGTVIGILTTPPPAVPTSQLTLIPGKTRLQVDKLLSSQGIRGSYLVATRHSKLLDPHSFGAPRSTPDLEGFLFPDTYQLRDPITVTELVAAQLARFKQQFATVNFGYARRKHLTPYDVLTIASMVEGETPNAHDRPYVAAVIYNRLRLGMTLGIDATTRYATGNYTSPLTNAQINSPSPYNTRIHTGLPPTPIDSPSLASIQAAAHPARSNALYFVATPCGNGRSTFTASYQQFLIDSQNYQNARAARGGKSPVSCK